MVTASIHRLMRSIAPSYVIWEFDVEFEPEGIMDQGQTSLLGCKLSHVIL